jgi:hypothetical protein
MNSGYLSARAKVNGKWLNLIIDTGSSATCLDPIRTRHLGLEWQKSGDSRRGERAITAATPGDGRAVTSISSFELGTNRIGIRRVWDFDFSGMNRMLEHWGDLPIDGLISADILEQTQATINYRDRQLLINIADPNDERD